MSFAQENFMTRLFELRHLSNGSVFLPELDNTDVYVPLPLPKSS